MKIVHKVLNIAAGKFDPIQLLAKRNFVVNLDTMYYNAMNPIEIEQLAEKDMLEMTSRLATSKLYCNADAFEFMERTKMKFDQVCIYRFLEHVPMDKVLYFIYLVSCVTEKGSQVDVIVPNYTILAELILNEDPYTLRFQQENIILTTELLNEPSCPHASIWTADRAKYFWELEDRFRVKLTFPSYKFDGRDIYVRFIAERV